MTKISFPQRITLCAMVTTLNVLFLYASETLGGMHLPIRVLFCFLSALPVQILLADSLKIGGWLSFLITAVLAFILCPDRFSWFFYVALLGHYGMMRAFFRRYINQVWVRGLFLVLYCNIGCVFAFWVLHTVAGVPYADLLSVDNLPFPPVICLLLVEAAFFFLEGLYEGFCRLYSTKLRVHLLYRR